MNSLSMTPTRDWLFADRAARCCRGRQHQRQWHESGVVGDSGAPSVAIPIDLATKVVAKLGGANDWTSKVGKADDAVGKAILLSTAGFAERKL